MKKGKKIFWGVEFSLLGIIVAVIVVALIGWICGVNLSEVSWFMPIVRLGVGSLGLCAMFLPFYFIWG